jgi:hypothetical protein
MVGDTIKQTRCSTCDFEHPYKEAKIPARRKKKDATSELFQQVLDNVTEGTKPAATASAAPPRLEEGRRSRVRAVVPDRTRAAGRRRDRIGRTRSSRTCNSRRAADSRDTVRCTGIGAPCGYSRGSRCRGGSRRACSPACRRIRRASSREHAGIGPRARRHAHAREDARGTRARRASGRIVEHRADRANIVRARDAGHRTAPRAEACRSARYATARPARRRRCRGESTARGGRITGHAGRRR